jgi:ankyrin repeat protein
MDINKQLKKAIRDGETEQLKLILNSAPRGVLDLNEALMKAVAYCRRDCAQILLEAHANPNYENDDYYTTPLQRTCEKRSGWDMCALLIAFGANVNKCNARGASPLHIVADGKNVECARILIEAKARVDKQDAWEGTPLTNAVRQDVDMTDLLLEAGAHLDDRVCITLKVRIFLDNRKAIKKVLVHIWCILHFRWKVCKDVTRLIMRSVWETRKEKIWENVKF